MVTIPCLILTSRRWAFPPMNVSRMPIENEEAGTTHCLSFCSALHEGAVNTHMPKPKKPRPLLYMSALQMMEGLSLIEEQGEYLELTENDYAIDASVAVRT